MSDLTLLADLLGSADFPAEVIKRSSMLCAIVAVARKLSGIQRRMWIDGNDFKVGFGAKVTQRLKLKQAQRSIAPIDDERSTGGAVSLLKREPIRDPRAR